MSPRGDDAEEFPEVVSDLEVPIVVDEIGVGFAEGADGIKED